MRVFLTGVTGYLGSRVAEELICDGHELAVMVRGPSDDAAARALGAWPMRVTLHDVARLSEVAAEVDAVAHCAASDDPAFLPVNRAAIAAMLGALRPGAAFVMHGGTLVFGDTGTRVFDGTEPLAPPPPLAPRAALDAFVLSAGAARGQRVAIVSAALAYGEGAGAVIPAALARAALTAGTAFHPADCDARWSAIHVRDWAGLMVAAIKHAPVGGRAFPAGGPPVAMRALAALIAGAAGLPAPIPAGHDQAERLWGPLGPALSLNQVFSSSRAEALLGWTSERNGLPEEIATLVSALSAQ